MKGLVLVSGASKGIGKAIALKFASEGFDVVISSRNEDNLNAVKSEIESVTDSKCYIFKADFEQKEAVKAFANFVLGLNIEIKALVNNAGIFVPGKISDESDETFEKIMHVNVFSAYYLTKMLLKKLSNAHIFNICSIASLSAYSNSGSYTISKFALLGFSKSLRQELIGTNTKVTSILPGATLTESWSGVDLPAERFMKAQDVADVIFASFGLSASANVEEIVLRPLLGDI
jgi:short-subunit dehydrogenase